MNLQGCFIVSAHWVLRELPPVLPAFIPDPEQERRYQEYATVKILRGETPMPPGLSPYQAQLWRKTQEEADGK